MQKILIATAAILLFAVVVVVFVNGTQHTMEDVRVTPQPVHAEQQQTPQVPAHIQGDAYACDAHITLYLNVRTNAADVTLVYPDNQYGTSALHSEQSTDQNVKAFYVNSEDKNVLTIYDDEIVTFTVNDVMIADNCVLQTLQKIVPQSL